MLEALTDDLWVETRPLRFCGVELGARMTVVRLADGSLIVHSPVALGSTTRDSIDKLGPVRALVAPNRFHHLSIAEWAAAYPQALVLGAPGLEKKRRDVNWSGVLGDGARTEWQSELDYVFFGAMPFSSELIFFHRPSRTVICSDFMVNLAAHPSRLTRIVSAVVAKSPGPTLLERVMIKDRDAAREQIGRIVAWGAERLIMAHGDTVLTQASECIRKGYAWV
jgi:hypothetical protein